jgi:hypothetical protein
LFILDYNGGSFALTKKIRITRATVGTYVPDFEEDFYFSHKVETFEAATEIDHKSLVKGEVTLEELCSDEETTYVLEIIDE